MGSAEEDEALEEGALLVEEGTELEDADDDSSEESSGETSPPIREAINPER